MDLSTSRSGPRKVWRVYFCPACTSIQSDTLKLPALSISAIVALDHLRCMLLRMLIILVRQGLRSVLCARCRSSALLCHTLGGYTEAVETFDAKAWRGERNGRRGLEVQTLARILAQRLFGRARRYTNGRIQPSRKQDACTYVPVPYMVPGETIQVWSQESSAFHESKHSVVASFQIAAEQTPGRMILR